MIRMTGAANNSRGGQRQYATTRRRPREGCAGDSREEGWAWAVKDVSIVASGGCSGAYGIFDVLRVMERGERESESASVYRVRA